MYVLAINQVAPLCTYQYARVRARVCVCVLQLLLLSAGCCARACVALMMTVNETTSEGDFFTSRL